MPERSRQALRLFTVVTTTAIVLGLATAFPEGQGRGGGGGQGQDGGRFGGGPGQGPGGGARGAGGRGQTRDNTNPAAVGTGAISGTVVLDVAGTPVRRARVTLMGPELGGARTSLSDDLGRFTFQLVPAGRFTMSASKAGYVDATYGAKRPGRPGTPIQLADGQQLDKMAIAMPRGSVITGTVVDEHGEAVPGTLVRAFRIVIRTGEKSLQATGSSQTDDRGIYRMYQLQPGDYIVSAMPRNMNVGDLRDFIAAQASQLQGSIGPGGGRGGGLGIDAGALSALATSPVAQQLLDRVSQLQQSLGSEPQQSTTYAPVYYPGTTSPSGASTLTIGIGEERTGVDFQLQLLATAKIDGTITSQDGGPLPNGTQVALIPSDRSGIPGMGVSMTRVDGTGHFTFRDVTPGQYAVQARATVRKPGDASGAGRGFAGGPAGGRGGRGGGGDFGPTPPGQVAQVLWASTDVSVTGQDLSGLNLPLQLGMTVVGHIEFQGTTTKPPSDLTRVRVSLTSRGQQTFEMGAVPPADVDPSGRFTITGVAPGKYSLSASAPIDNTAQSGAIGVPVARGRAGGGAPGSSGSGWSLKSVVINGRDVLDFPVEIGPSGDVPDALVTFSDKTQELSGTIQDASGVPAPDFTIIVFPSDKRYWLPQARRITSTRPGTDGKFTLRGLPAGDYRMTAVTDVEPGEWYDPAFLEQLQGASIPIALKDGEKKVQDVKLATGN